MVTNLSVTYSLGLPGAAEKTGSRVQGHCLRELIISVRKRTALGVNYAGIPQQGGASSPRQTCVFFLLLC